MFEREDVKLTFSDGALEAISEKAVKRNTGARGLRSILETILLDTMYQLPELQGVEEIMINKEVPEENGKPLYIYAERHNEVESSA